MTWALVARELTLAAVRPAFAAAAVAHVALLALFLLAWSDVAAFGQLVPGTPYQQLRGVQAVTLTLILPWAACRCLAGERGADLAHLCARLAVRPGAATAARLAAAWLALALLALTGLPLALLAFRMTDTPAAAFLLDEASHLGIAMVAGAAAVAARQAMPAVVGAWSVAALVTAAVVAAALRAGGPAASAGLLIAAGGALGLAAAYRAERTLRWVEAPAA